MKSKYLFLILTGTVVLFSVSCRSTSSASGPAERSESKTVRNREKEREIRKSRSSLQNGSAETQTPKERKTRTLTAGELLYKQACQVKDAKKRFSLFRKARLQLEKEIASGKKGPEHLRIHLLLGFIADMGLGMDYSDGIMAAQHYRAAADGGLEAGRIALVEFWLRRRMFLKDALDQLQMIPDGEKKPNVLRLKGALLYNQSRRKEGFEYFKKMLALRPVPHEYINMARKTLQSAYELFLKARKYDDAMKELEREQILAPKDSVVPYFMGTLEELRKNDVKAEAFYDKAINMDPAMPFAYRALALLQARKGRAVEALENIKVAYAVSRKHNSVLDALIRVHLRLKKEKELFELLALYQKKQPGNQALRKYRVVLYLSVKDYRGACRELEILIRDPKEAQNTFVLESLALAATYTGKLKEASSAYEKMLKKSFQAVAAINLAELYFVQKEYAKVLLLLENKELQKSADLTVRCIVPYLKASALLAGGKDASSQIKAFEKAVQMYLKQGKKDWDVHLVISFLNREKTLSAEARKEIRRMTELIRGKREQLPSGKKK